MPQVSVFIASYNHARYIGQALDSVLAQTYRDFEIVVVDDGSTDGSHELLLDYQQRYPDQVRYSWHAGRANKGVTATSNVGIARSQGEYLAWLGSDDVWYPHKLEKQMAHFAAQPAAGMVCSYATVVDENDRPFPGVMGKDVSRDAFRQLVVGNVICPSTIVVTRACLNDVGVFNEKLVYSDWELFIRIAAKYPVGFIAEPLASYRMHGRNMSVHGQAATKLERNLAVIETVFQEVPEADPALKDQALAAIYFSTALDFYGAGQSETAKGYVALTRQHLNGSLPFEADELIETVVAYAMHSFRGSPADKVQFVRTVFAAVAPALERKAVAQLHINNSFTSHLRGDASGARQNILRALRNDPSWIRNPGVRSIGAQAVLGRRAVNTLKRIAHRFRRSSK
jgi:glycosyltransferase involved in cell wall biosynthesis